MDPFDLVSLSLPHPSNDEWTDKEDSAVAKQSVAGKGSGADKER